jgi:hypothetical protein
VIAIFIFRLIFSDRNISRQPAATVHLARPSLTYNIFLPKTEFQLQFHQAHDNQSIH